MNLLNTDPRRGAAHLPSISVVIPALNEEKFIKQTIMQLSDQRYPTEKLEIIVIDGGSTDGTIDILKSLINESAADIHLLQNPKKLSSISRNMGIRSSRSDYILFVDAHVHIPSNTLIRDMADAILEHRPAVLGRPQPLTAPSLNVFQEATAAVRTSFLGHSRSSYIYSGHHGWASPLSIGVMYKRSLFDAFGLFDESFDAAEDLEFNSRLEDHGICALTSPDFTIYYHPRKGIRQLFHQMHRYGLGRMRFFQKHPHRNQQEVYVPYLAPLLALFIVTLGLMFESARLPLAGTTLLGVLFIIGASAIHLPRATIASVVLIPLCFIIIHLGMSSGVTRGLLRPVKPNISPHSDEGLSRESQKMPI